jgi:hypothetical protein
VVSEEGDEMPEKNEADDAPGVDVTCEELVKERRCKKAA